MATPQTTKIVWTIQDQKGKLSRFTLNIPYVEPHLIASADDSPISVSQQATDLLRQFIDGEIKSVNVIYPVDISGVPANTAHVTSDVEEGLKLTLKTENGYSSVLRIPTVSNEIGTDFWFTPSGEMVQNSFTANLIFLLTDYPGYSSVSTVQFTDSRGDPLKVVTSAREDFKP